MFICCFLRYFNSLLCFLLAHDEATEILAHLMLYSLLVFFFLVDQYYSSPRSQLALIRLQSELFVSLFSFLFKTHLFGELSFFFKGIGNYIPLLDLRFAGFFPY